MNKKYIKRLLFHLILIWFATFLGGFIVGFASALAGKALSINLIAISNIITVCIAMFWISIKHQITWQNFALLFALLAITSLINLLFTQVTFNQVLLGTVFTTLIGALAKVSGDAYYRRTQSS